MCLDLPAVMGDNTFEADLIFVIYDQWAEETRGTILLQLAQYGLVILNWSGKVKIVRYGSLYFNCTSTCSLHNL